MEKIKNGIIITTSLLFLIGTILMQKYNGEIVEVELVSINTLLGMMLGYGINLIIDYPKTKEYLMLISSVAISCLMIVCFALGFAAREVSDVFICIGFALLSLVGILILFFTLKQLKENGQ